MDLATCQGNDTEFDTSQRAGHEYSYLIYLYWSMIHLCWHVISFSERLTCHDLLWPGSGLCLNRDRVNDSSGFSKMSWGIGGKVGRGKGAERVLKGKRAVRMWVNVEKGDAARQQWVWVNEKIELLIELMACLQPWLVPPVPEDVTRNWDKQLGYITTQPCLYS